VRVIIVIIKIFTIIIIIIIIINIIMLIVRSYGGAAVGIRHGDHAAPSIRKKIGTKLRRQAAVARSV
jgi:hypothetical protein